MEFLAVTLPDFGSWLGEGFSRVMTIPGVQSVGTFLVLLTALVFVHEFGHYYVARRNGVRIEVFSIGFGPEIFGWYDKSGTRWKFSAIPLGGYVRMFGDSDATSVMGDLSRPMTEAERAVSFHHKRLAQRVAIVSAGPIANFIFAIIVFTGIFATVGQPYAPPVVGTVEPRSAAAEGGLKPGDRFITIDGRAVSRFEELQQAVMLNTGKPMSFVISRDGREMAVIMTPHVTETTDRFGNIHRMPLLGVKRFGTDYLRLSPPRAFLHAVEETWDLSAGALTALGQIISGARSSDELSGPLGIAKMSGEVAEGGLVSILGFAALISVNLGLINLFPVPALDGGHLLFYAAEALRGRPLGQRAQEYGFRLGLALVLMLMVLATWNDLVHLKVIQFFKGLIT